MKGTFDLTGFLGYLRFKVDGDQHRPYVDHQMCFRAENDATVIVPPDVLPVGLLYFDAVRQRFEVKTVFPGQGEFR